MENIKICPQCGASSEMESKFCNQCGYRYPEISVNANNNSPVSQADGQVNMGAVTTPKEVKIPDEIKVEETKVEETKVEETKVEETKVSDEIKVSEVKPLPIGTDAPTEKTIEASPLPMSSDNKNMDNIGTIPVMGMGTNNIGATPMPGQPVNNMGAAPMPGQPVNNMGAAPMPGQPVNNMGAAPMPGQPVNNMGAAPMPEQTVNNMGVNPGLNINPSTAPTQGTYTAPVSPTNPAEPPKKKGKGALVGVLIGIIVAVIGIVVAIVLALSGKFGGKKTIELSESKIRIEEDEEYEIEVNNYKDLGKPSFTIEIEDDSIVEVEDNGDGTFTITGLEEGKTNVTVSAKKCEDAVIKVTVEEATVVATPATTVTDVEIAGSAWTSEDINYYFFDNGRYYSISDSRDDYLVGTYTITEITKEDVPASAGSDLTEYVTNGTYYSIACDIEQEYFSGTSFDNSGYNLILCTNGTDAAIYNPDMVLVGAASEISLGSESSLLDYFDMAGSGTTTDPDPQVSTGGISGINFGSAGINVKETWRMASYGEDIIFEYDGDLYHLDASSATSGGSASSFYDFGSQEVTVFAVYEDYFVFGKGAGSETYELCCMDLTTGSEWSLVSLDVRDFIIINGAIYGTDYSELWKIDFDGGYETVWDYGVFTFEIDNNYIYIFDGNSWEVLDVNTYEDYGYITTGINGDYESDVVRSEDGYLFFTTYDEYTEDITLYAMDLDGNMTQIGDSHWGEDYDTYNLVFVDKYAVYSIDGGETIVCTDVTTGEQTLISFDDYDYYYSPEFMLIEGMVVCYTLDYSQTPHYVWFDHETMDLIDIPQLTMN